MSDHREPRDTRTCDDLELEAGERGGLDGLERRVSELCDDEFLYLLGRYGGGDGGQRWGGVERGGRALRVGGRHAVDDGIA